MGNSMRDQLLKAGLVSEKQVRTAESESRRGARKARKQKGAAASPEPMEDVKREVARARNRKVLDDRDRARQQRERQERKELRARVRDHLKREQLLDPAADIPRSFVEGTKVKRIYVTASQQEQLAGGKLAIVELNGRHYLVPVAAADKALEWLPGLSVYREPGEDRKTPDPDDPYAAYEVPDDLMW